MSLFGQLQKFRQDGITAYCVLSNMRVYRVEQWSFVLRGTVRVVLYPIGSGNWLDSIEAEYSDDIPDSVVHVVRRIRG